MRLRATVPELMDLDTCDPQLLEKTLLQFAPINRWFSAFRGLIRTRFFPLMRRDRSRQYTLLDIGVGGGDIDVWIAREARRQGVALRITAIDRDERVLKTARKVTAGYPEITLLRADAGNLASLGRFDFIFSNHLLHHLTGEQVGALLGAVERAATIAYLLDDLERSRWAYLGYTLLSALLFRRSLAFHDGRLSIRKAFTGRELRELTARYLPGIPLTHLHCFPSRLVLYRCKSGE
jgi:2-polyprenyl-3-methyl-5-hydroxy-6-metoxy-1,4-benzoquinol methylase